jgi:hypothetical protein
MGNDAPISFGGSVDDLENRFAIIIMTGSNGAYDRNSASSPGSMG